ncbi:hypothetical protein KI387_012015, partial [Taxus chinensis]
PYTAPMFATLPPPPKIQDSWKTGRLIAGITEPMQTPHKNEKGLSGTLPPHISRKREKLDGPDDRHPNPPTTTTAMNPVLPPELIPHYDSPSSDVLRSPTDRVNTHQDQGKTELRVVKGGPL